MIDLYVVGQYRRRYIETGVCTIAVITEIVIERALYFSINP